MAATGYPGPVQSPSAACTSASAATPAVSARRIRGPSDSRSVRGCRSSSARSSSANPPSGPIRTSIPSVADQSLLQRLQRDMPMSAASSQNTSRRLVSRSLEIAIERDRLGDRGKAQDAALLGGLDDIGAHPLAVDPRDLGDARQHRLQRRGTHLDRLLHHVVEPGVFQRRKDIGDVGQAILRPGPGDDASDCRAACGLRSAPAIRRRGR